MSNRVDRFFKGIRNLEQLDIVNSYVLVDNSGFKAPHVISVENIGKSLGLKIEGDLSAMNVSSVEMTGQESNPALPPDSVSFIPKTHIAVDENYLYVWIPKISKWKRLLLSDWNSEGA
jgi:hypothetical protein